MLEKVWIGQGSCRREWNELCIMYYDYSQYSVIQECDIAALSDTAENGMHKYPNTKM